MEGKHNDSTPQRPKGNRTIDAQQVEVDLKRLLKQIKEESSWEDSKRNAITIFKTDGLRIVLIALHKGTEMARHTANGVISVQVLEGHMQFKTDRQTTELFESQILVLHEQIPHSVLAIKETVFLLTITSSIVKR
ncbi:MAG: cupin domain-containing protein [Flavisolibacter sp.]